MVCNGILMETIGISVKICFVFFLAGIIIMFSVQFSFFCHSVRIYLCKIRPFRFVLISISIYYNLYDRSCP